MFGIDAIYGKMMCTFHFQIRLSQIPNYFLNYKTYYKNGTLRYLELLPGPRTLNRGGHPVDAGGDDDDETVN